LIKCNRAQALHMTASYSLSGASHVAASVLPAAVIEDLKT
jgi:hypothetical protein